MLAFMGEGVLEFLNGLLSELTSGDRPILSILFFLNIILLVLSRPIINLLAPDQDNKTKIKIAQALNLLVLLFQFIDFGMRQSFDWYGGGYLVNLGASLMIIYTGVFLYSASGTFTRKRFGKSRTFDDKVTYIESYNSRLVNIVLLAIIVLTIVYILIKIWGADSLLETTGIIGILLVFLGFTSSIWAPDIVSGLIILNSEMLVDGDVVVIDGHPDEFIIARVTLIYAVLYDVRNNHRTLLRNTQFIQSRIDNLSRIASSDGIRQAFKYNIGYPEFSDKRESRETELVAFQKNIGDMFTRSFEACQANDEIKINKNKPFEWALTNAGDYALEYTMWVYLDRIPNTKVTATIRRHLMGTLYKVNEAVFTASVVEGVDLSTPDLVNARISNTANLADPEKIS
ncbi:MAG: hypothetical protein ABJO36_11220 [Litorimonas sp.]